MNRQNPVTTWIRLVISAVMAIAVGIVLTPNGGQAAIEYPIGDLTQLTRFQMDGDPLPYVTSNPIPGPDYTTDVTLDFDISDPNHPYGPKGITGPNPPASIPSTGLLPLTFGDIRSDDFPRAFPARNPQYPDITNDPADEFCDTKDDDIWTGGTKATTSLVDIDDPLDGPGDTINLTCGQALDKGDVVSAYTAYEIVTTPATPGDAAGGGANHTVLYGAWERAPKPGELNFYIPISDGVDGNTEFDRLIAFDYDSSAPARFRILGWDAATDSWTVLSQGSETKGVFQARVGYADGSPFPANGQPSFGEFAIDLTALGLLPDTVNGRCIDVETAGYIFTETGNSSNAQLKDYVRAPKLPIGNCGDLAVTKAGPVDAGTVEGGFPYEVQQRDGGVVYNDGALPAGQASNLVIRDTLQIDDTDTWNNVYADPDYVVFEPSATVPSDWKQVSVDCTFVDQFTADFPTVTENMFTGDVNDLGGSNPNVFLQVQSNAFLELILKPDFTPSCTITNTTSGVVIEKTGSGSAATFDFTVDGDPVSIALGASSEVFTFPPDTTVAITELVENDESLQWNFEGVVCDDGTSSDSRTVDVQTVADTIITCTFTNVQEAKLFIAKTGEPADGTVFEFDTGSSGIVPVPISADAIAGAVEVPGVDSSEPIRINERTPDGWELNDVSCAISGGANSTQPSTFDYDTADDVVVDLAAGEIVLCTFTNTENGTIIVDKTTDIGDATFTFESDDQFDFDAGNTDTITTFGNVTPTDDRLIVEVAPGTYAVDEIATAGYFVNSIACTDEIGEDSSGSGGTATYVVAAGETVSCTFDNHRYTANLTLAKVWGDSFVGDQVVIEAEGDDPDTSGPVATSATAPTGASTSQLLVHSGETVTLREAFTPPADIDNYSIKVVCTGGLAVDTADVSVVDTPSGPIAEYVLPPFGDGPLTDTNCEFQNKLKTAQVIVQKEWDDGRSDDRAILSVTGQNGTEMATSTSDGTAGVVTDSTNQAVLDVFAGEDITFGEDVLDPADADVSGLYVNSWSCTDGTLGTGAGGTVNVSAEEAAGDPIVCTIKNKRKTATLQLTKGWADSPVSSDTVQLRIGATEPYLDTTTSTANVPPASPAEAVVLVGESYDISEAFTSGNAANYDIDWSCTNAAADSGTGPSGSVELGAADANNAVLCTITNDRYSTTLTFAKAWENGAPNDVANLTVTPLLSPASGPISAVVPAGGDGPSAETVTAVTVYAGERITLAEAFVDDGVLDDVDGTYDVTSLECPAATNAVAGWTGAADLDGTLDIAPADNGTPISCSITNTRRQAELTLIKTWDDPLGGSDLDIAAFGDDPNNGDTVNESTTSPAGASGTMTIFSGETISLSETFTADTGDIEFFTTTLNCGADDLAVDKDALAGAWSTTIAAGDDPQDTTCTFGNVRDRTQLRLRKTWVDSAATDAYGLEILATEVDPLAPVQAVAPGGDGLGTGTTEVTVYAGEQVTLTETPAAGNIGTYDVTDLACSTPGAAWTSGGSATFDVDGVNVDAALITCTFTNARTSTTFQLVKTWDDPVGDSSVELDSLGSDPIVRDPIAAATSPSNVVSTSTPLMTVFSGETVSFSEDFGDFAEASLFETTLSCNGSDPAPQAADGEGVIALTIGVPKVGPQPITCTFDNFRKRTQLTLAKAWVAPVDGDTATLAIGSTTSGATPVPGVIAPATAPMASTTVYAGETVTLSEDNDPGDANKAVYDVTDFVCDDGDDGVVGPDLDWSGLATDTDATLAITAADTEAPISCTVTNTAQRGTITIVKNIDGVNDGTFDFSGDWTDDGVTPVGAFQIDTSAEDPALTGMVTYGGVLVPKDGSPYSVVETDAGANFDGTRVICADIDGGSGPAGPDGSSALPLTGSIDLDASEAVLCTFTNTEKSKIIVVKDAQPDSTAEFDFTGDLGDFTLVDDGVDDVTDRFESGLLNAEDGSVYTIDELTPAGWRLASASCVGADGDELTDAGLLVEVAPGVTAQCTFVNEALPVGLTATKAVEGVVGDWGPFTFSLAGGPFVGDADQDVDDIAATPESKTAEWTELVEGVLYTLTENQVPGYETGAAFTCDVLLPGDDVASGLIDASADPGFQFLAVAGATYSCDITNVAIPPMLVVEKTTVGGTGVFTFDATPTDAAYPVGPLTADTTVTNPASTAAVDLQAGVGYAVAERDEIGWIEGDLTCTVTPADGSGAIAYVSDTITQPGDVISCEIENVRQAQIIVEKTTVPAASAGDFGFEASWNGAADGTADFTLADGETENSGFIDPDVEYTITELDAQGFALTGVECTPSGTGSVANSNAIVTPAPGGIITCEFTNTQRGEVTVVKDAVTDVTRVGTTYSVTYEVTVGNTSYTDELYTLTDTPDMADNVTITSMVVTGPGLAAGGVDIAPDGGVVVTDGTVTARAGQTDGPDALVYTVVTEFTMTPSNTAQECVSGVSGNGAYNGVTVTFAQPPTTNSDDACVDLPTPDIDVEKVADAPVATQVGDTFQYQADYTVTVTNAGEGPGSYSITDLPDFGSGDVDSVTLDPLPGLTNVLEPGAQDVYDVTVLFTVAGDLDLALRECGETPTPGQGGYNSVTISYGPTPDPTDDACVVIPDPEITVSKVRTTDTATLVSGNTYEAQYMITVDNTGDGPGAYSVADLPDFGTGADIVSTTIVPDPATSTPIEAGGQDVYTVTIEFTVDGDMDVTERECSVDRDEAGFGAYNGVTVTWNDQQTSTDEDCIDIPNPNVDDSKIVVDDAAVYNGDNEWTVTYQVDVTNLDPSLDEAAGPALYDLTDTFDFGPGVTVDNVVVTPTPDTLVVVPGFDGDAQNVLVDDTLITRNETHTYTIVVDVTIVPTEGTNGDCTNDGGLNNAAGLSAATDPELAERANREACASFSTLTLIKELSEEDDGGNADIGDFTLTATLEGELILSGTVFVTESVPAGDYVLAETQQPGYTSEGFTCGQATMNGQTVTVPLGDNVVCTIINDDLPVDLAIDKDDDGFTTIAGGDPVPYTIEVRNVGTRDADLGEPVTVVDTLPAFMSWNSYPADCTAAGKVLTCDIDPALMTAGGPAVVIETLVDVAADAPSGELVNEVYVTTEDDPVCEPVGECEPPPCEEADSSNNIDCEPTEITRFATITIVKVDDVPNGETVFPGDTYTYRLRVTNNGPSVILPGLAVDDDLPEQLEFVSATGNDWTCNAADPIVCTYGPNLNPGTTAPSITVTVRVAELATGEFIENTATATGFVERDCSDVPAGLGTAISPCDPIKDADDETTPLQANADLAIVKTASVAQVGAGNSFTWTLEVTNNGPAPAINVTVGDLVPAATSVTGVSSSFFDCSRSGNDVTCTVGSMDIDESGSITIAVVAPSGAAAATVVNVGTVASDTPDPNLDNNSDDAQVVIVAQIPPTTVAPTIPATGSDSTAPMIRTALVFLFLGAIGVATTRRRRQDEITSTT